MLKIEFLCGSFLNKYFKLDSQIEICPKTCFNYLITLKTHTIFCLTRELLFWFPISWDCSFHATLPKYFKSIENAHNLETFASHLKNWEEYFKIGLFDCQEIEIFSYSKLLFNLNLRNKKSEVFCTKFVRNREKIRSIFGNFLFSREKIYFNGFFFQFCWLDLFLWFPLWEHKVDREISFDFEWLNAYM